MPVHVTGGSHLNLISFTLEYDFIHTNGSNVSVDKLHSEFFLFDDSPVHCLHPIIHELDKYYHEWCLMDSYDCVS